MTSPGTQHGGPGSHATGDRRPDEGRGRRGEERPGSGRAGIVASRQNDEVDVILGWFTWAAGIALMLTGAAVGVCQAVLWLRYGAWRALPLSEIWTALNNGRPMPRAEGGGLPQILEWIFEQSIAVALLCVGGLMFIWGRRKIGR